MTKEFFQTLKRKFIATFSFLKNGHSLFYYFLFLLGVGIIFFAVSLFTNYFTTPFSGDYNTQQYAFYLNLYDDWWHFIKTGSFRLYDTNTYLGVNNIGSNSFYSLFDPFFFLVLISPRAWMGQAMAISTIIRMSLAGFTFYGYLRYMKVSDKSARIAGLVYAYCGWTTWYLWFNCYTENALTFILILWGVEKIIKEKKPWLLMASLFLAGLVNYFFLVCFTMMAFVYAMFRYFQRLKENTVKDNILIISIGFAGFFVGLLMSSVIVLPSIMVAMNAPRAADSTYSEMLVSFIKSGKWNDLFSYIFDWAKVDTRNKYRAFFPVIDFFYPAMSDRGTPLMQYGNETYDNVAGSIYSYYPFIILLIPALIRSIKQKKWSHLIAFVLLVFTLFTPFFYYLFFGFTKPYSRWTLFITTSLLTYGAMYLDHIKEEPKWTLFAGYIFALGGIVASAVISSKVVIESSSFAERFSIQTTAIIASCYVTVLLIVWLIFVDKKIMDKLLIGFITIEAGVMGACTILGHGTTHYPNVNYGYDKNTALSTLVSRINNDDKTYFRCVSSIAADSNKNDGARNGYNGVSFFHSVYNFNVQNFTYWSMLMISKSGWSGRYVEKRSDFDKFLGVKYYFIEKDRVKGFTPNVPFTFTDVSDQYPNNYFYVFQDQEHIDFAFSYDDIYPYNETLNMMEVDGLSSTSAWLALRNDELYLKGAILEENDANEIFEAVPTLNKKEIEPSTYSLDAKKIYAKNGSLDWRSQTYKLGGKGKTMDIQTILSKVHNDANKVDRPAMNASQYAIVIRPGEGKEDLYYDENGYVFYLNSSFKSNQKIDVYLIDTDDNVITYDNHNDDRTTDSSSRRGPRGLYVRKIGDNPAPKTKEIIIVPRWGLFNEREDIYFESYTTFKENKINELLAYPIENVNYRDDHFSFETNFESKRMIVTQIAYDSGWSVKAKLPNGTTKKLKTYLSHGGFVSFVSEEGNVKYEMDYYTPYLRTGIYLSSAGMLMFVSTLVAYVYLDLRKKYNLSI